jgi:hypothetical protein
MADETTQATFNEVIDLGVDLPKFQQSLQEALKIWEQFQANLDGKAAEGLFGPGLIKEIREFKEEQSTVFAESAQGIKNIESMFLEYLDKVDTKQEDNASKQRVRVKNAAEQDLSERRKHEERLADVQRNRLNEEMQQAEAIAEEQEVARRAALEYTETRRKLEESLSQSSRGRLNEELQQAEATFKAEEEQAKLAQKAVEQRAKAEELLARGARGRLNEELQIAEALHIEQERAAELAKLEEQLARNRRDQQIAQDQRNAAQARKDQERAVIEDARTRRRNQAIDTDIEGGFNRAEDERLKAEQAINAEREKAITLESRLTAASLGTRSAKVVQLEKERAEALSKAADAARRLHNQEFQSAEDPLREQLRLLKEQNDARTRAISLQSQITSQLNQQTRAQNAADRASQGFFGRLTSNVQGSLAHLVRFYFLWNALDALLSGIGAVISAPFKAIAEGVQHLQDTQKQADSLLAVLLANAKFSENIAENFKLAKEAAFDLVKILQEQAIDQNLNPEQIEATFKALLQGGVGRLEGDLKNVVTLASTFQQALEAAGVGGLAAQGSIQEINKLMVGNVDATNKFLVAIKATPEEWRKILAEAGKNRNLLDLLAERIKPFRDALKEAQGSQAVLLGNFNLLRQRIEGIGAEKLFDTISSGLLKVNEFLRDNERSIGRWFKFFVDAVESIARSQAKLALAFTGKNGVAEIFTSLVDNAVKFKNVVNELTFDVREMLAGWEALTSKKLVGPEARQKDREDRVAAIEEERRQFREQSRLEKQEMDALRTGRAEPRRRGSARTTFDPVSVIQTGEPQVSLLRKQLSEERQEFEHAASELQRIYDRQKEQLQEQLADKKLTFGEFASGLAEINAEEVAKLEALSAKFQETARKIRAQVAGDPATKPLQRAEAVKDVERETRSAAEFVRRRVEGETKEVSAARKRAIAEEEAILQEGFEQRLRINKIGYDIEQQLISELVNEGSLTRLAALEQETEQAEREHEDRQALFDSQLTGFKKGTKEYVELVNRKAAEDFKYTEAAVVRSKRRQAVEEEENAKRLQHQQRLRVMLLESDALSLQITQSILPPTGFDAAQDALFEKKEREIEQLRQEVALHLEIARAKNADSDETRALTLELQNLYNQRLALFRDRVTNAGSGVDNPAIRRQLQLDAARDSHRSLVNRESELLERRDGVFDQAELDAIDRELEQVRKQQEQFRLAIEQATPNLRGSFKRLLDVFVGFDLKKAMQGAETATEKFAVGLNAAAGVLANLGSIIDTFKQGKQQGGVLGGIGAVGSQLSGVLSSIPVIGQFIPAISGILSFVGGLFTAAAKKIAEDVKRSFQNTIDQYQNGNATLIETLGMLEAQRRDAIIRLSGKKGGKDELDKILPEFDRELEQLRKQQQQILGDFDTQLESLRLQSDTLGQVKKQWQDINKQVKDYLGAGGDAGKAAEFLSLQLAKIKEQALDQFSDAEQEAIQSALRLNDLLKQRDDMVKDFKQKEFDLINEGSIERRQAGSVRRGTELQRLREQHQEALANLDSEINRTNVKVEREREIFNLATDAAALRRRDEELTLEALDKQIQKYRDLKSIINGDFSFGSNAFTPVGNNITVEVNFNGPVTSEGAVDGIMDSLQTELDRQGRLAIR